MRGRGQGWVTAEYGMLPRATHTRGRREASKASSPGRTQEIQRLIGCSLRAVVDPVALGERQISLDCDVIQADGGTRTAAITGAWVALRLATKYLMDEGLITTDPIIDQVAAISCGVFKGVPVLDLEYEEDSNAEADANFVLTGKGDIVEIQATGEKRGFTQGEFEALFSLARKGSANSACCSARPPAARAPPESAKQGSRYENAAQGGGRGVVGHRPRRPARREEPRRTNA